MSDNQAPAAPTPPSAVPLSGAQPVTPQSNPVPLGTPQAAPSSEWMAGLNDDTKGYIQNKGFKSPSDVLDSYRNLEKLHGAGPDKLLRIPDNLDSPESRAVWERLGAPKEAKGYSLEMPQGADPKLSEWAAGEFHKLGVPKGMAEGFVKAWNAKTATEIAAQQAQAQQAQQTAVANLKTQWGMAYDQNVAKVEQAAGVLGLTPENLQVLHQALGPEAAPKLLLKLAAATQEHEFINGNAPQTSVNTPEAAQQMINEKMKDQGFMSNLFNGDVAAKNEWTRLHQQLSPGMRNV